MQTKSKSCMPVGVALFFLCLIGCDGYFERSRPTSEAYLDRFLRELSPTGITRLNYTFNGTVGGYISLARIEVSNVHMLDPIWQLPQEQILEFSSSGRDLEIEFVRTKFVIAAANKDKSLPVWMDLSFSEPVYIHGDAIGKAMHRKFFMQRDKKAFYLIVAGD